MVAQGAADPADKNKLRKAITKYRNMMADPSLSAADKQKLRLEGQYPRTGDARVSWEEAPLATQEDLRLCHTDEYINSYEDH